MHESAFAAFVLPLIEIRPRWSGGEPAAYFVLAVVTDFRAGELLLCAC
jgi:hypothetical protein